MIKKAKLNNIQGLFFCFSKNTPNLYFVSAAAWAFIFASRRTVQKKTNQKKLHSANSRSQNSIYQLVKIKTLAQNFDRVQTVLSDIWNHYFINIFSRMAVIKNWMKITDKDKKLSQ